jgi:hypothetical protein
MNHTTNNVVSFQPGSSRPLRGGRCTKATGLPLHLHRTSPSSIALATVWVALAWAVPAGTWAMGPAAPFTPPRAAAPPLPAAQAAPNLRAVHAQAPAAAASSPEATLTDAALQGVRTGPQPVALLEGRWWALGTGPDGRRITAIDSRGIWITLAPSPEHAKAPVRQQRLLLLPNAAVSGPPNPSPVLTASAHGARP